jgi:hypothetical protein
MRKTVLPAVLLLSAMIAVTGCGQKSGGAPVTNGSTVSPQASVTASAAPEPTASGKAAPEPTPTAKTLPPVDENKLTIQVYYADKNVDKLVAADQEIRYTTGESKYLSALKAMTESMDPEKFPLCKGFTFHSAVLKDGNLTVNLAFDAKSQMGSDGETLLLQAIPKTLFQFPEVKTIDLLVDGKKVDSLMGHVDLPHPIKRTT